MSQASFDRRSALALAGGGMTLLLAGCKSNVHQMVWPDITFGHEPTIRLAVAEINFVGPSGQPNIQPPAQNIEFALPISPVDTMRRWTQQRLAAVGSSGKATMTITENRFTETPLATTGGIQGLFTNQQQARYDGTLACRLDLSDNANGAGYVKARAVASRTVAQGYSVDKRQQALYDMIAEMVRGLDQRLDQEIHKNLAQFIVS